MCPQQSPHLPSSPHCSTGSAALQRNATKAQKQQKRENPSSLLCCKWMFHHLNPLAAVIHTCWYFSALPRLAHWFPCPGGTGPWGDAGGVPPQVQSSPGCRGRAPWEGQAEPFPCPVTPARHTRCTLIFSQQPPSNQSLLKALIKTLTFLIPSIFCSLLIK